MIRAGEKNVFVTTTEAARLIGVTPDYVRYLILHGKIRALKVGNQWLIKPTALRHFERQRFSRKESENGSC